VIVNWRATNSAPEAKSAKAQQRNHMTHHIAKRRQLAIDEVNFSPVWMPLIGCHRALRTVGLSWKYGFGHGTVFPWGRKPIQFR